MCWPDLPGHLVLQVSHQKSTSKLILCPIIIKTYGKTWSDIWTWSEAWSQFSHKPYSSVNICCKLLNLKLFVTQQKLFIQYHGFDYFFVPRTVYENYFIIFRHQIFGLTFVILALQPRSCCRAAASGVVSPFPAH